MGTLKVINESSLQLCRLYIAPNNSNDWGQDQLGGDVINAGSTYTITDIPFGTYKLKVTDCDDNSLAERTGVTIDGPFEWTLTD
jgi:hypothetical protein